jgi:hypothetical protein
MDLTEFHKDFHEQVGVWASADMNFKHSAFVEYAAHLLEEAEEVYDFQSCYYRGTGSRNRQLSIDGYSFDDADGSVRLFVAEPFENNQAEIQTLNQTQAKTLFARVQAFFEDSIGGRLGRTLEESSPAHALASTLEEQSSATTRLRLYLITDGLLSSRVMDWPEAAVGTIPVEYNIWDISRFHRVATSKTGKDELLIDFTALIPEGIPCLKASLDVEKYRAYLCIIPGIILADMYDFYGSRLLEGNVRSFLSTKGRVNKGIRNTVLNEPEMFFAYNNGIAATCSEAEIESSANGLRIIRAKDLQIVNGAQTTASLASARRRDRVGLEETMVPMKLSIVTPDISGQIIPLISRYANMQNKVSDADFFSNHEFHRRIEQISRRIWAPAKGGSQHETHWFYERARGQYQNEYAGMSPAERKRFLIMNPREQVITKTDLAKFENVWDQLPHVVSLGAQKNFLTFAASITKEWEKDNSQFSEEYFRRIVARAILFHRTEKLVSSQPWYQGGYRAQIVAHTISKLSHLVQAKGKGRKFDYRSIWQRQALSPALEEQIQLTASQIFEILIAPPTGFQNVTEWSKKEPCWRQIEATSVELLPAFLAELVDPEEDRAMRRDGHSQQVIDSGIEAQLEVVNLGGEYWGKLRSWGRAQRLLSPEEERLTMVAASIPNKLPTDWQSSRLIQIRERLELEGFRVS